VSARTRRAALVALLALAGLVLAVALAILTSRLTTQHVGLAGEPLRPKAGLVNRPPARTSPSPGNPATPTHDGETERGDD
jgi:hypothetical protein